jgi:hypothetical protein
MEEVEGRREICKSLVGNRIEFSNWSVHAIPVDRERVYCSQISRARGRESAARNEGGRSLFSYFAQVDRWMQEARST